MAAAVLPFSVDVDDIELIESRTLEVEEVAPIFSADPREVIRCAACLLNQFMPANECCRRCHVALRLQAVKAKAEVVEIVTLAQRQAEKRARYQEQKPEIRIDQAVKLGRNILGISQRDLAQRMDVTRTYVSKIENQRATPIITLLPRLANALELSVYQLVMLATL